MGLFKKLLAFGSLGIIIAGITLIILISIYEGTDYVVVILAILAALYIINILFAIYVFYSKKRNSIEKKCWMMLLICLPILGVITFLKYGFNPFHKTNFKNQVACRQMLNQMDLNTKKRKAKNHLFNHLSQFSINVTDSFPNIGDIEYIDNVEVLYQMSIDAIRSAKKMIILNFYIINDGVWLKTVVNELKKQADKGIKIYFLFDWFGSKKRFPKMFLSKLRAAGIKISIFRPKRLWYLSGYDNSRSHKKMLIIDNTLCLYGGFNLADEYINYSPKYEYWRDDAFVIKGEIIKEYIKSFACDWVVYSDNNNTKALIEDIEKLNLFDTIETPGNSLIQLFDSTPELSEYQMINFLIMSLTQAKKRIWINTPYLYPTEYLINVLIGMSKSDVDIRILVPGLSDNKKIILSLNKSQYNKLIDAGIKIYEIDGFLHAKSIIIDDDISLIGTCNLDPRAMNLNYENTSVVESKVLNKVLSDNFEHKIKSANLIPPHSKKLLTIKERFLVKLMMIWEPLF